MRKEIGSIFPLYPESFANVDETSELYSKKDVLLYSLCREALYDIACSLSQNNKIVLLPAYTCQTVITPFEEAGWTCHYFNIYKSLKIDIDDLCEKAKSLHPTLVLVHPYYGMDLQADETRVLQEISNMGIKTIVDLTQCIFSTQRLPFVDFYVGSYRKWFPIPDGGFLSFRTTDERIIQPHTENDAFVQRQTDAMYLRGQYFRNEDQHTKAISIRLSKSADHVSETDIHPHCMSLFSRHQLPKEDFQFNQQQRIANYTYLFEHIHACEKYQPICEDIHRVTTAPLYYTLYVSHRSDLQKRLAAVSAYAPVVWPLEDERILINADTKYIYDHILALPCDQRYDINDMERMVNIIKHF